MQKIQLKEESLKLEKVILLIFQIWILQTISFKKNNILKFIESFGTFYHIEKNNNYWDYLGYHDFADTKPKDEFTIIQSFEEFGEYDITPHYSVEDPYLS